MLFYDLEIFIIKTYGDDQIKHKPDTMESAY